MKRSEDATIKVIAGPEKRSKVVTEKEKRLTAYHEAGHAVCTYYCPTQDPVHEISIIPLGNGRPAIPSRCLRTTGAILPRLPCRRTLLPCWAAVWQS